jgi:starvation-inducible DNA-binding protein
MASPQTNQQVQPQKQNEIVASLQKQVANAFVLYMNYKHYHWQVYGPLFRDLHKLFDEFAAETLETIDEFAERIRMIGEDPVADPKEVLKVASVPVAQKKEDVRQMITEADEIVKNLIIEMREGGKIADSAGDIGTNDLFAKTVQIYEKQEWWLRDILKKGDKLIS